MPRAACATCHDHPANLPTVVCRACGDQSRRDLAALPEWHDDLLLPPSSGPASGPRTTRGPVACPDCEAGRQCARSHLDARAPLSDRAGDLRHTMRATLVGWARVIVEEMADAPEWPDDTVPAIAAWLLEHDAYLLAHDAGGDYVRELRELVRDAERAAAPGRSNLVAVGTHHCDGEHAGHTGRVLIDPATRDGWCTLCRERADLQWWRDRLAPDGEPMRLVDLPLWLGLHHGLDVTLDQLRRWSRPMRIRGHAETCTDPVCGGCATTPAPLSAVGLDGEHIPEGERRGRVLRYDPVAVARVVRGMLERRGKVSA